MYYYSSNSPRPATDLCGAGWQPAADCGCPLGAARRAELACARDDLAPGSPEYPPRLGCGSAALWGGPPGPRPAPWPASRRSPNTRSCERRSGQPRPSRTGGPAPRSPRPHPIPRLSPAERIARLYRFTAASKETPHDRAWFARQRSRHLQPDYLAPDALPVRLLHSGVRQPDERELRPERAEAGPGNVQRRLRPGRGHFLHRLFVLPGPQQHGAAEGRRAALAGAHHDRVGTGFGRHHVRHRGHQLSAFSAFCWARWNRASFRE